ncbi:hypothetical protein [Bacillus alkalicellulosilyticus]|uniref:hypothetical protein n=1 Tax=Alkalihalobacterium alkalicellulosilyticum TaxID=1912214 RepID=UPI000997D95B|nr:hypothetical protein [Bacillus alkalicellulosilyticus]
MRYLLVLLVSVATLTACGFGTQQTTPPLQLGDEAIVNQKMADEAKKIILSMDEVIEVVGVSHKDNIYIAPTVTHFNRLRLETIRKTGFNKIKKRYPDATVFLTTDKKLVMELDKLEQDLKAQQISEETLEKRLTKIEDDMKG